jgi:V/A-type H+-transporting ATPase subunit E
MSAESLNEVIEKLKREGIDAAKVDADRIKEKAEADAETTEIEAKAKAKALVNQAEAEAKKIRDQLQVEMERATKIALAAFKSSVEKALVVPAIDESLATLLTTPAHMEKIIAEMIKGFAANNLKGADLDVILPESMKDQLGSAFVAKMKLMTAGGAVNVLFDDNIRFGFKIGPGGEGFVFDLTDEGLREIFVKFVSPKFRNLFFGSN